MEPEGETGLSSMPGRRDINLLQQSRDELSTTPIHGLIIEGGFPCHNRSPAVSWIARPVQRCRERACERPSLREGFISLTGNRRAFVGI
jgi:hypothetical protein